MSETILISFARYEMRAAVLSHGAVQELFIERSRKRTVVGNIYKGRVVKVLPGMQSAFVDIGLSKAAFLHVADMIADMDSFTEGEFDEEEESDNIELEHDEKEKFGLPHIEDMLTEGQEIMVQVAKDAIGSKGARLTMHLSIPGRHLVLMPHYPHIGVSRKIEDHEEREKLREILRSLRPDDSGLIARTVSKGQSYDELRLDRDYLQRIWGRVKARSDDSKAPRLAYEDGNLIMRLLRDVVGDHTGHIIIDNTFEYENMLAYCRDFYPELLGCIELYDKEEPLFEKYNVEIEISRLLDKKIWLRSGGYIVIDQAEALTVIDVNTGKFVGKRNFEETIFKTNIEAAREIAHQLWLRNIGGIVIVDFIDMETEENIEKVLTLLDGLLREDRSRASVVNITPLGLVEITRKRAQESLIRILSEACPYCEGRGVIKSRLTVCYNILRHIRRIGPDCRGHVVLLEAHNEIADILLSNERESLVELEKEFHIKIEVKFRANFHLEHYELISVDKVK